MTIADATELRDPPHAELQGVRWLLAEAWHHLWPWPDSLQHLRGGLIATAVLAVAASAAWVLAALGQLGSLAVIGWWCGWSFVEIWVRQHVKPYVKEGPWWGRCYRRADWMDMACYVAFKNLLIGAALFLSIRIWIGFAA